MGSSLALGLVSAGHSVAVIDRKPDAFRRLGTGFSGTMVQGVGFDRGSLAQAGVERAGSVAAVTSGDNSNIVVARVARETFGVERVVARIYDPRRAAIYQRLGIATVASVAWSTERVLRHIVPDQDTTEWIDPSANVSLVERVIEAHWAGQPVAALERTGMARVVALSQLGVGRVPTSDTLLQNGDIAYLAVRDPSLAELADRPVRAPY